MTEDEALKDALDAAGDRMTGLNNALSQAAYRFGGVTMKLAIGAALRDAGFYAEATIALNVEQPAFQAEIDKYEHAIEVVQQDHKGTVQ